MCTNSQIDWGWLSVSSWNSPPAAWWGLIAGQPIATQEAPNVIDAHCQAVVALHAHEQRSALDNA